MGQWINHKHTGRWILNSVFRSWLQEVKGKKKEKISRVIFKLTHSEVDAPLVCELEESFLVMGRGVGSDHIHRSADLQLHAGSANCHVPIRVGIGAMSNRKIFGMKHPKGSWSTSPRATWFIARMKADDYHTWWPHAVKTFSGLVSNIPSPFPPYLFF
jgi:hypothetical protein